MNGERTIALRSRGRHLIIEVHQRPYPNSDSELDQGAIHATIVAEAGPFRASIATMVWKQDVANFLDTLKRLNDAVGREASASTTLGGYEPPVEIKFELGKRGNLNVRVTLVDDPLTTAELWFVMEADQSYLARWIVDVENLVGSLD